MKTFVIAAALVASVAAAKPVEWEFPRDTDCHEGLPFADGVTGVLVWGGGSVLNLTVGRADLWDHRGGYPWTPEQNYTNIIAAVATRDEARLKTLFVNEPPANWGGRYNPYMLPLGRVIVTLKGRTLKSGSLDPRTGLGELRLDDGSVVELAMSKPERMFAMRFPDGVDFEVATKHCMEFAALRRILEPRGFRSATPFAAEPGVCGFHWRLPADSPVSLVCRRDGASLGVRTGCGDRVEAVKVDFAKAKGDSLAYWKAFWDESAQVSVPDEDVQRLFDYGMYRFGAMTDPDGVPAGLQGAWLEDDRLVPWNGDYHFNINVQQCYSPAYRGGHLANLRPLFRMVKGWWPLLRDNARKLCGVEDGFVLPHSVDDRGVCIGGFWAGTIDHASTAWVAAMMFRYVRYSGDLAFLRSDAYPFMRGAMNVYRALMEERDGRLSIPIGPSPEWGGSDVRRCVGRDPSFQLAAAHRLARDPVDAVKLLGEAPDPMWLDVERRLPQYTKGPGGFQLFEGQPFSESHRHHSHMGALYPFNTLDLDDPAVRADAAATYRNWVLKGTGAWSGWCVPWAAILNVHLGHPEAAVHMLRSWETFYTNPGHGSCHDAQRPGFSTMMGRTVMQMDGQCAAAAAVMEMMVHETGAKVEYFKGCPSAWKRVSFENIRLADGTRVSGVRENGKVTIRR